MGVYCDDGRGGAFCRQMKLFHLQRHDWLPGEAFQAETIPSDTYNARRSGLVGLTNQFQR